jgi:type I restriction enzyme S subunit
MSGWPTVRLEECAEIVSGATPSTSESAYWDGDICWATPKDLSELDGAYISDTPRKITRGGLQSCAATVLPPDSVLFSSRAPIGHVAINTVPMATNQGFKSFVPKRERVHAKFLYHWLRRNRPYLESLGNGATFKEVSKAVVARIEIPTPSLPEQRRIAEILDKADALRAKRRAALAQLDTLTQSIFLDMFGDPATNPKGWPTARLGELCTRITDGTHQPPKWSETGHPFLFVSNVISGELTFDTAKFISDETHTELMRRCPVEVGDVLYSTVGSYGVPALVRTRQRFAFQRHIAHLKPDRTILDPLFLRVMLASPPLKRQADTAARGVAQKTVNLGDIREFVTFKPPLDVQRGFAHRISKVDALSAGHSASLGQLETLFTSLQHRAFRGEL